MRARTLAVAAAATLATTSGVAASSAAAGTDCGVPPAIVSTHVSPPTLVVGVTFTGIVITSKVRTNGCAVNRVEAGLYGPHFIDSFDLSSVSTSAGVTTFDTGLRITPGMLANSEAGTWTSSVTVWGERTAAAAGPQFRILRASRLAADATPEPVRAGRTVTVTGRLTRVAWDTLTYRGYGNRRVQLQWRSPNGSYRRVKTVTASATGRLQNRVQAVRAGCYRFVFKGSRTTAPVKSRGDCVDMT